MATRHAAVDLGASNGRLMVASVTPESVTLEETHRFPNGAVRVGDGLFTDALGLYAGVVEGLARAAGAGELASVGVDSWGVDYGRLDARGELLGAPRHYRDARTDATRRALAERLADADAFAATGIQPAPYNTVYQLMDDLTSPQWPLVDTVLFTPDLMGYWLSGVRVAETTIASTSMLLDAATRAWSPTLAAASGVDLRVFAPLTEPGTRLGPLRAHVGAGSAELVAVGGHDTASALVATPARDEHFAFISCGTWSIVGAELRAPITSAEAFAAGFTNELGVDGTVRFNRNLTGLWLLQECQRAWRLRGEDADLHRLLAAAAASPGLRSVVDAGSERFLAPDDMPERLADECRRTGQPVPDSPGATVRCVLDSLALSHARAVRQVQELGGPEARTVHLVGGGSRNELLCRLTADACGLPVVAGPVEAAALGNAVVQARAVGALAGDLTALRRIVAASGGLSVYEPSGTASAWRAAEGRLDVAD